MTFWSLPVFRRAYGAVPCSVCICPVTTLTILPSLCGWFRPHSPAARSEPRSVYCSLCICTAACRSIEPGLQPLLSTGPGDGPGYKYAHSMHAHSAACPQRSGLGSVTEASKMCLIILTHCSTSQHSTKLHNLIKKHTAQGAARARRHAPPCAVRLPP